MSEATQAFGFGKFIPGFDFLQQLAKAGKGAAAMPPFSHWVAPTMSVEEIDKRIEELKAVQFWLDQNSRALSATVQALQVQKMTLSTLAGMNVNMTEISKLFPFGAAVGGSAAAPTAGVQPSAAAAVPPLSGWPLSADKSPPVSPATPAAQPKSEAKTAAFGTEPGGQAMSQDAGNTSPIGLQAMQWWGALTQQFQQIATQALQDPAQQAAMVQATHMASDFAKAAVKSASDIMRSAVKTTSTTTAAGPSTGATSGSSKPAATKKSVARKTTAAKTSAVKKTSISKTANSEK